MNGLKIFPLFLIVSVLHGCSVSSSQLTSIIETLKPSFELQNNTWTLNYGEYRATVYAVAVKDGTLFSNEFGDQLLFDGWNLKEVTGLGIRRANWKIVDSNKKRRFFHGNRFVAEHLCGPWVSAQKFGLIRYSRDCRNITPHKNNIVVNEKGVITLIKQIVDGSESFLTLSKNK